jgi:hypothetical protein
MGASPASNHRSGGGPPFGHVDVDVLRLNGVVLVLVWLRQW